MVHVVIDIPKRLLIQEVVYATQLCHTSRSIRNGTKLKNSRMVVEITKREAYE